jgi:hypothetical protein
VQKLARPRDLDSHVSTPVEFLEIFINERTKNRERDLLPPTRLKRFFTTAPAGRSGPILLLTIVGYISRKNIAHMQCGYSAQLRTYIPRKKKVRNIFFSFSFSLGGNESSVTPMMKSEKRASFRVQKSAQSNSFHSTSMCELLLCMIHFVPRVSSRL